MTKQYLIACVTVAGLGCSNASPGSSPDAGVPDSSPDAESTDSEVPLQREVATDRGPVVGHIAGATTAFLGIPYAAPPVGALRWRAPTEHAAWSAPLDAGALGSACAQTAGALGGQTGPYSEDCLTLNVWTPDPSAAAHAPVMVFIHGGAFIHGGSNQATYDGQALATAGVVVVTMNYRLGVFGFLAHAALTAEDDHHSSGNVGLLDQQAALRWVQTNIAGFGGDPGKVTVFGESAGAMSVCAHIASPLAAGLFQRALGESGSCLFFATPLVTPAGSARASAESLGAAVAHTLGCDTAADVLACMRGKSSDEVLAAGPSSENPAEPGVRLQPNIDGYVLAEPPAVAFAAGRTNPLAGFLGGINRDEATLFTRTLTIDTQAQYEAQVTALVPDHASEAIALYDPASYPTFKDAYNALLTDVVFACQTRAQTRQLASRGTATYLYLMTRPTVFGTATGLGVYHGSELEFVFGNLSARSGTSNAARAFSAQLMGYWTRFAATGSPSGASATPWPSRTASVDAYLELGEPTQAGVGFHATTCDAIEQWRAQP
jgi:para-nitrobenzyl esterase